MDNKQNATVKNATVKNATMQNPLATEKIGVLLRKFAIPSVVAMLVTAVYNMVDQIFIGNAIGELGNAATNVTFPLSTLSIAMALLIGQGGASKQNLELGAGNKKRAELTVGTVMILSIVTSIVLAVVAFIFIEPLLSIFGATRNVMPYALEYGRIILMGVPFIVLGSCLNNSIRADTSAQYAMVSMAAGAVTNIILDALFIFGFGWGMKGAALATIIGQILTCLISLAYIPRYKHLKITRECMKFDGEIAKTVVALGIAPCINQLSMFVVQIVLNNLMRSYGERSIYGADTPIACIGIVMKVNMIFMSIVIGVGQGTQPIISYNYGAKDYHRCRSTYRRAAKVNVIISIIFFVLFQLMPNHILSMFGDGSDAYFKFGVMCFRIYLFMTFINGLQPLTTMFFTAIGKAKVGAFIALTRQIIFLIPIAIILPIFMGIKGIMYAAPVADFMAFVLVVFFIVREFKLMREQAVS